jgi:hypothetical protein
MWDVVLIVVLVVLFVGLAIWKSLTSGDLKQLIEFGKMASQMNDDLFGGQTRVFVLNENGQERKVGVTTRNEAANLLFSTNATTSTLSYGEEGLSGFHVVINIYSEHGDDFMKLTEKQGEDITNTTKFNLDKMEPGAMMNAVAELLLRMSASANNDGPALDKEAAAAASAWGVVQQD